MEKMLLIGVNAVLYLMAAAGVFLLCRKGIHLLIERVRMQKRLRARDRQTSGENPIFDHLDLVMATALNMQMGKGVFLWGSGIIFSVVTVVGFRTLALSAAIFLGGMAATFPYLILRVRLELRRKRNSFEGEALVSAFLSNYRLCGFNIFEAIEKTSLEKKGACGKLLYKMLVILQRTASKSTIREAAEQFSFSINTNWSRMLGRNIALAAESGINIAPALEDILIQLREARSAAEERKRLNAEASKMVLFLIPAMYLLTVAASFKTLSIPPAKLIQNQFFTPEGFLLLTACFFLFLINLILIQMVNNQKFDY